MILLHVFLSYGKVYLLWPVSDRAHTWLGQETGHSGYVAFLQFGAGWRFDFGSLLIGLMLGILLTAAFLRLLPILRRWRQQAIGYVRQRLAWMRSGVEVRFQAETAEYARQHHLGREWAALDEVFVPPRLLAPLPEIDPVIAPDWGAVQINYLWPDLAGEIATPTPATMSARQLLVNGRRVLISAEAGAGKSTLLAYFAYLYAAATLDDPELLATIPILAHLAELNLAAAADPLSPLISALQKRSSPITGAGLKTLLPQKFKSGQILLLLDGWDEFPAAQWAEAVAWLRNLLERYPNIQVIMAAPLTGYGPLLELEFTLAGLIPWRAGQVESFAAQWTKAFPLSQPPRQKQYWRPGQLALENSLRFWLAAPGNGANGNGNGAKRPQRHFDLMEASLPLLAGAATNLAPPDPITLAFWQRLAYALVAEDKLSLTKDAAAVILEKTLARHEVTDRGAANRLQKTIEQSSLFVTWPGGTLGFTCVAWRDFLAAAYMARNGLREVAAAHLCQPHWRGVLRFYVAQAGATELAAQLLEVKDTSLTRDALFQVASWMPEACDSGEWRRQTLILLGQMIRQPTFAQVLRQRAAVALARSAETGVFAFLSQLLERSDPFLRQAGVTALSHLGSKKVIELLAQMMADGNGRVRRAAVHALAWLHHPQAERPLITALISEDEAMSRIAAEGLVLNGSEGIQILKEAVEDEDLQVRRTAVFGLALLDEEWVVALLKDVERRDEEWLVRSAATSALEMIEERGQPAPWRPLQPGEQRWLAEYASQEGRTVPDGAAALPFLVQILAESSWPKMRAAAAATLGQLPAKDALPALETAVRDSDDQVREAAFTTLCLIRRAYGG